MKTKEVAYKEFGKKRTRCSKCGELGILHRYKGEYPAGMFLHKAKQGFMNTISKSCVFKTQIEL